MSFIVCCACSLCEFVVRVRCACAIDLAVLTPSSVVRLPQGSPTLRSMLPRTRSFASTRSETLSTSKGR